MNEDTCKTCGCFYEGVECKDCKDSEITFDKWKEMTEISVKGIFETSLAKSIPGYQKRESQIQMALGVEDIIKRKGQSIIEGPTGTGKSFAYLTAVIKSHKKTVISTGNIALQEQLIEKDLPFLQTIGDIPDFKFAIRKGIGNYICDERVSETIDDIAFHAEGDESLARLIAWASDSDTGDKSDFDGDKRHWGKVSTSSELCTRDKCRFKDSCRGLLAIKEATEADVVVCNHHVYVADMKVREITKDAVAVLPQHDVVVFDEAHKLPDVARSFLGETATYFKAIWPLKVLRNFQEAPLKQKLETVFQASFDALAEFHESKKYNGGNFSPRNVEDVKSILKPILKGLKEVRGFIDDELDIGIEDKKLRTRAMSSMSAIDNLFEILKLEGNDNKITFLEMNKERVKIVSKFLDVSQIIKKSLKDKTVIHTSATISDNGNFSFFMSESGSEDFETMTVDSPFDYQNNVMMIIPRNHPSPKNDRWQFDTNAAILEAVMQSKGRALCLFTSYKSLKSTENVLRKADLPFQILSQNSDMSRKKLVQEFKKDKSSILLGTESFWTGVDVPGEALSLLIIDKLPFPHPADPIVSALGEGKGRAFFGSWMVPKSIIDFRQGFGRAIRRDDDQAVIICFDNRLLTTGYGRRYLNSLPPMHMREDIGNRIEAFFKYHRSQNLKKQLLDESIPDIFDYPLEEKSLTQGKVDDIKEEYNLNRNVLMNHFSSGEFNPGNVEKPDDIDFFRRKIFASLRENLPGYDTNLLRKSYIIEHYKVNSFTKMSKEQMEEMSDVIAGLDVDSGKVWANIYLQKHHQRKGEQNA